MILDEDVNGFKSQRGGRGGGGGKKKGKKVRHHPSDTTEFNKIICSTLAEQAHTTSSDLGSNRGVRSDAT